MSNASLTKQAHCSRLFIRSPLEVTVMHVQSSNSLTDMFYFEAQRILLVLHTIWITLTIFFNMFKYPRIFNILFSHSWPVVLYNLSRTQGSSQVERKTKCTKPKGVRYSCTLDCLVNIDMHVSVFRCPVWPVWRRTVIIISALKQRPSTLNWWKSLGMFVFFISCNRSLWLSNTLIIEELSRVGQVL